MKEQIRFRHINDLHSHFEAYPKIQRFFKSDAQDWEVLRFDLGDNVDKSHPLTAATSGQINVKLMNDLQLDFATIGNNEGVGLAKSELDCLYSQADFQVILSNLSDEKGSPAWAKSYVIYETQKGTKIALLGATFPYYVTYEPNGWQVADPISALKRDLAVAEVEKADFRVLLSHLGLRMDEAICHQLPQIDLIIGAHTHHVFEAGEEINGVYLAAAGRYGEFVGQIDMLFDNHKLEEIAIQAIATSQLPTEKSDADLTQSLFDQGVDLLSRKLVYRFPVKPSLEDCLQVVMKSMLAAAKADLTIINTGLIVQLFEQNLTRAGLHQALPHQMRLITVEVTKTDLVAICREMFSQAELLVNQKIRGMGFRGETFGQLITDGFTYKNGKIVYNEKVRDNQETLRLVLVDHYYFAPYFDKLKKYQVKLLFPELLREHVENYLKGEL